MKRLIAIYVFNAWEERNMSLGTRAKYAFYSTAAICLLTTGQSLAADETPHKTQEIAEAQKQASTRIGPTSGTPVNTMISGGGVIARGKLLTQVNSSFRDKDDIVENAGAGARTSKQLIALLKLRYGLTDNLEALLVPGYIYVHRDAYDRFDSDHLGGPNDAKLGINYGILQQKQGDPLSLCLTLGLNLPTGQSGARHPPGNDVWSYNAALGITKVWPSGHRIDGAVGFTQPTETGNLGVRKDTSFTLTGSYRYIFNPNFDAGLEFTVENSREWQQNGVDMHNGYTEMYAGPAINVNFPDWGMWVGVGAYLPVFRDYDAPTATDDIRIDFKLGKMWSW